MSKFMKILFMNTLLFINVSIIHSMEINEISEDQSLIYLYNTMTPLQEAKLLSLQSSFDEKKKDREDFQRVLEVVKIDQRHESPSPHIEELQFELVTIRIQRKTLKAEMAKRTMSINNTADYASSRELIPISVTALNRMIDGEISKNQTDAETYNLLVEEETKIEHALIEARRAAEDRSSQTMSEKY